MAWLISRICSWCGRKFTFPGSTDPWPDLCEECDVIDSDDEA